MFRKYLQKPYMDKYEKKQYHWVPKTKRKKVRDHFISEHCQIDPSFYDQHEAVFFELIHPKSKLNDLGIPYDEDWVKV